MSTGRRKLLLADDSPTIRKVISLTFADEGMEVVTVSDGRQALRLLEIERPPDIVLADAVMPGPDGYELCERIKGDERLRHVPVVLLVGTFEPYNEAEARRVGADTVLTKPFQSIRDLVSKVGSLLGGESKPEAEESDSASSAEAARREPAEEYMTRRADPPAERAPGGDSSVGREAAAPEDPSASFANLGVDDEMIETTPADAFGGAAAPSSAGARTFAEFDEPLAGEPAFAPRAARGASASSAAPAAPPFDFDDDSPFGDLYRETPQPSFNRAGVEEGARPAFAVQAAGASAADDALLDLGRIEPPAAEADEFILDLDEDFPAGREAGADESPLSFDDLDDTRADAAGAFAEAAHGEAAAPTEASRTPFEFSSVPAETDAYDPALVREVDGQDVPPTNAAPAPEDSAVGAAEMGDAAAEGLATSYLGGRQGVTEPTAEGDTANAASGRAREFIEPQVVPADEPVPATFEGRFTDGSVEGDVPKPPSFIPDAPAPPPAFPAEPSAAGFAVGEARAGADERVSPARLSPETIEAVARRVVELMSEKVVREIAWEVVPDLAELLIKQRLDEERGRQ